MSQNLQNFSKALHMLRNVATRVPADAWSNASCCDGWDARQVAGHATWVINTVTAGAIGAEKPAAQAEADIAGANPAASVCSAVDSCLGALDQPGALDREYESLFGHMSVDAFLGSIIPDPLAHTWDIADAAGIHHGIDAATANHAMSVLEPASDSLRAPGMLGQIVSTDSADSVEKLIAFTGRTSVRA